MLNMPYIPEAHKKYNLLPFCTKNGGEVFSYPSDPQDPVPVCVPGQTMIPYGYDSYEEFYGFLDDCIAQYGTENGELTELGEKIAGYRESIKRMNVKENWSVCRYIGETDSSFTHGRYYYWPCSIENPEYEGVIDDEEFTSYYAAVRGEKDESGRYAPANAHIDEYAKPLLWEIAEDPTGMAARTLSSGDAYMEDAE
jgi:hypothetical protein